MPKKKKCISNVTKTSKPKHWQKYRTSPNLNVKKQY